MQRCFGDNGKSSVFIRGQLSWLVCHVKGLFNDGIIMSCIVMLWQCYEGLMTEASAKVLAPTTHTNSTRWPCCYGRMLCLSLPCCSHLTSQTTLDARVSNTSSSLMRRMVNKNKNKTNDQIEWEFTKFVSQNLIDTHSQREADGLESF